MELNRIAEAAIDGQVSTRQLAEWVAGHQATYLEPPLREAIRRGDSREAIDGLIKEYSAWQMRMHEFQRKLMELRQLTHQLARNEPARSVHIGRVMYAISRLSDDEHPLAHGAFTLGYACWRAKQHFDAADALTEAAERFRRDGRQPLLEVMALSYLCDSLLEDRVRPAN